MSKFVGAPAAETTCLLISGIFIHLRRSAPDSGHYLSCLRVCEVSDERLSVVTAIFGKRGAPAPRFLATCRVMAFSVLAVIGPDGRTISLECRIILALFVFCSCKCWLARVKEPSMGKVPFTSQQERCSNFFLLLGFALEFSGPFCISTRESLFVVVEKSCPPLTLKLFKT